jgi:transposase
MATEEKKSYKDEMADLERRRIRGVQKILDGVKPIEVARELEVSPSAVSRWMSKYRQKGWDGLKAKPKPGRPIIFADRHREKLFEIISRSPYSWGYESDVWTVVMARDVLYEHTETYFSKTRVLSALHELGFSFQKPQVRALEKKTIKSSNG